MTSSSSRASDAPFTDLHLGLAGWGLFIVATCAYCLIHQAFVSGVGPDVARTVSIALREWGAWALLAPWALRIFRVPIPWRAALLRCALLALAAASVPMLVDLLTAERSFSSSLALFWPRNFAVAVALGAIARLLGPSAPAQKPSTLMVNKGADQCLIRIDDIQYLSAAGNYVDICARGQSYLLRTTMADLEALLPAEHFVRIHRSHIVRVGEIERIGIARSGSGTVHLRGGKALALSRTCRAQLRRHADALKPVVH